MGTDSFMEMLRCDLNQLALGNPVVVERVYGDLDGWHAWACETLAKHGNELEIQVVSRIIATLRMSGDVACLRKMFNEPIYTNGDFTGLGERLLQGYALVIQQQIQDLTHAHLCRDRRKQIRLVISQFGG